MNEFGGNRQAVAILRQTQSEIPCKPSAAEPLYPDL
jgi:hypothetical protein